MGHVNVDFFRLPTQLFGIFGAYILAVDIAIDAFERFEGTEAVGQRDRTEVAGMPDLVAGLEVAENGFV